MAETAEALVVGERPAQPRPGARPPRAARAGMRRVRVDDGRVVWRSRIGVSGALRLDGIARVALIEVEYLRMRGPNVIVLYALALDRVGAVRLRVVAGGSPTAAGAEGKRRLRELWEATGVPVARENSLLGRAKDYRRRYPEAFSFAHAYPLSLTALVMLGWMLLVVPVLDRLLGT